MNAAQSKLEVFIRASYEPLKEYMYMLILYVNNTYLNWRRCLLFVHR